MQLILSTSEILNVTLNCEETVSDLGSSSDEAPGQKAKYSLTKLKEVKCLCDKPFYACTLLTPVTVHSYFFIHVCENTSTSLNIPTVNQPFLCYQNMKLPIIIKKNRQGSFSKTILYIVMSKTTC